MSNNFIISTGGGGGTPGGSNTQIQFNSSGSFAGSADLTWDGTKAAILKALFGGSSIGPLLKVETGRAALFLSGTNGGVTWSNASASEGGGVSQDAGLRRNAPGQVAVCDGDVALGANADLIVRLIALGSFVVGSLPSASASGAGANCFVTDALAPVFGSTVAGSGAVFTPIYSDGTNWKVG